MELTRIAKRPAASTRLGATVREVCQSLRDEKVGALAVIDKGRLRYDGDLPTLVRSVRPHKRIAVRLGIAPSPAAALDRSIYERMGTIIEWSATRAVIQVQGSELRAVGKRSQILLKRRRIRRHRHFGSDESGE